MPIKAYFQSSVVFIPWKENVVLSFGVSCILGNTFTKPRLLCIDHKPLEWLAIVSNAYGRRGCWIVVVQDVQFKIVH
jgi:hypothetical protein